MNICSVLYLWLLHQNTIFGLLSYRTYGCCTIMHYLESPATMINAAAPLIELPSYCTYSWCTKYNIWTPPLLHLRLLHHNSLFRLPSYYSFGCRTTFSTPQPPQLQLLHQNTIIVFPATALMVATPKYNIWTPQLLYLQLLHHNALFGLLSLEEP